MFLLMFYFWITKRTSDFQLTSGNSSFWEHENVLSPEGSGESRIESGPTVFTYVLYPQRTLRKQNAYEVYLIFFPFYPPMGLCESRNRMGSVWYSYQFIVFREGCLILLIYKRKFRDPRESLSFYSHSQSQLFFLWWMEDNRGGEWMKSHFTFI